MLTFFLNDAGIVVKADKWGKVTLKKQNIRKISINGEKKTESFVVVGCEIGRKCF